jgi:hypothetical protein
MVLVIVIVWAIQPQPVSLSSQQTFDTSEEGWFAYGTGARVQVTTERANIKEGAGALELEYTAAAGQLGSAVVLVTDGALATMQALRFWIKTDDDTAAAVVLSEKRPNGGDYAAWFWSPKDVWQLIELRPEDFALNEGPSDAKDANGRLDLDQVQAVGFIDLGQVFGSISQDPTYPLILKQLTGLHRLHVDDFGVVRGGFVRAGPRTRIGDPARGFISWITLGGARLSLSKPGNPMNVIAFEAAYERIPGKYVALAHGLSNLQLGGAKALSFEAASLQPARITVYLEERNPDNDSGPRYSYTLEVAGGSVASRKTLALSEFAYDATSPPDSDGRLTPERLRTISLIDTTGAALIAAERNTFWISSVETISQ